MMRWRVLILVLVGLLTGQQALAALSPTNHWRVRPSATASNTNGGSYDVYANTAATGSNGTFSGTTFTDATAAAFTSGMVGASLNVPRVGQWKIDAYIDASHVTISSSVPPTMTAPMNWAVGAGTDYSQQNSAQVVFNGSTITATTSGISTTILITGYAAAATDVGNAINITGGTNFTTGWYTIVSVSPGVSGVGTWTLDRNATSGAGTGMVGRMGGAWADLRNNWNTTNLKQGNTIYILGTRTPALTYDGSGNISSSNCSSSNNDYDASSYNDFSSIGYLAYIVIAGDPATPGYIPNSPAGGAPCLYVSGGFWLYGGMFDIQKIWFVQGAASTNSPSMRASYSHFDQAGYDHQFTFQWGGFAIDVISSIAKRSTNANPCVILSPWDYLLEHSRVYNCIGDGITIYQGTGQIQHNIIARNGRDGILAHSNTEAFGYIIEHNTIDANVGYGINITDGGGGRNANAIFYGTIDNNIISNHTATSVRNPTYGIYNDQNTIVQNDNLKRFLDCNTFFGNTTDLLLVTHGPNDKVLSSSPYVNSAASPPDYTLVSSVVNTGCPTTKFPGY